MEPIENQITTLKELQDIVRKIIRHNRKIKQYKRQQRRQE